MLKRLSALIIASAALVGALEDPVREADQFRQHAQSISFE